MTPILDSELQILTLIKTQLSNYISHPKRDTETHVSMFCSMSSFKHIT